MDTAEALPAGGLALGTELPPGHPLLRALRMDLDRILREQAVYASH